MLVSCLSWKASFQGLFKVLRSNKKIFRSDLVKIEMKEAFTTIYSFSKYMKSLLWNIIV